MSDHDKVDDWDEVSLTDRERERYDRQMMIEGFGEEGQKKLKSTTALIAGAGGLGSPVLIYLAAAGVGKLKIVDNDVVDLSNLNRQVLYDEDDVGRAKSSTSKGVLSRLNSDIEIESFGGKIDDGNVGDVVGGCDLIVDCLDNYETRYVLNRASVKNEIPYFHAAVEGFRGQVTTLIPGETPCLKCIVPTPPSSGKFPILGATAGLLGCLEVREVIRYVVGLTPRLKNKLLIVDGQEEFEKVEISRNPDCEVCGRSF